MSNVLIASIKADFKQRVRQSSFVITLLVMALLTVLFFPAPSAEYQTLVINGYRGIYNSAWIGICLASLNVTLLPIICFYLVKNTINNDRRLLVSELIAATPVNKIHYLFAKWLVSVIVLSAVMVVMITISVLMQLYFGESYAINLWQIIWPQMVFVLPLLLAIASIALFFETVPWLRGGLGNVAYFFIWVTTLIKLIASGSGISVIHTQIQQNIATLHPETALDSSISIGTSLSENEISTFIWHGATISPEIFIDVLPITLSSVLFLIVAIMLFDRFTHGGATTSKTSNHFIDRKLSLIGAACDALFKKMTSISAFTRQVRLEVLLLIKGLSKYWYIAIIGLNIAQIFVPLATLNQVIIPLSWLMCVLILSPIGVRSHLNNTDSLLSYCNFSINKQALSVISAATLLLLLTTSGGLIRLVATGELLIVAQMFIATFFISSLAFFCATLTNTNRTFEVIYPALWYLGPLHAALYLDYFGVNSQLSWQANMPLYFLGIAILLFTIGLLKSHRNYVLR